MRNYRIAAAIAALGLLAGCKYAPIPKTPPPTISNPPTTSVPSDTNSAASKFGWEFNGEGDEFNGSSLNTTKWGTYNGSGHAGNGVRSSDQISVTNGVLVIAGNSSGKTGGMAYQKNFELQRWEARIRIPEKGDNDYSAVFLLWVANNKDFPCKGEIDPFEHRTDGNTFGSFLHYSCDNKQTQSKTEFNPQEWNNIAVERSSTAVRYFLNGKQVFEDTTPDHQPQGPYHPTFQLDLFADAGGQTPSRMEVDYLRGYRI